jgi:hypothetical protein
MVHSESYDKRIVSVFIAISFGPEGAEGSDLQPKYNGMIAAINKWIISLVIILCLHPSAAP